MGRRKIEMVPIPNDRHRNVTFSKRKGGLIRKATELSVLCGANVSVLVFGANQKATMYSSGPFDEMLKRFSEYDDVPEVHTTEDYFRERARREALENEQEVRARQRLGGDDGQHLGGMCSGCAGSSGDSLHPGAFSALPGGTSSSSLWSRPAGGSNGLGQLSSTAFAQVAQGGGYGSRMGPMTSGTGFGDPHQLMTQPLSLGPAPPGNAFSNGSEMFLRRPQAQPPPPLYGPMGAQHLGQPLPSQQRMTQQMPMHQQHMGQHMGQSMGQTMGQSMGQTMGQNMGQSMGQSMGQTMGQNMGQAMGQSMGQAMGQSTGQSMGQSMGQTMGQAMGQSMGQTMGQSMGQPQLRTPMSGGDPGSHLPSQPYGSSLHAPMMAQPTSMPQSMSMPQPTSMPQSMSMPQPTSMPRALSQPVGSQMPLGGGQIGPHMPQPLNAQNQMSQQGMASLYTGAPVSEHPTGGVSYPSLGINGQGMNNQGMNSQGMNSQGMSGPGLGSQTLGSQSLGGEISGNGFDSEAKRARTDAFSCCYGTAGCDAGGTHTGHHPGGPHPGAGHAGHCCAGSPRLGGGSHSQCAQPLGCGMQAAGGMGCNGEAGVGGVHSAFHQTGPACGREGGPSAWHAPQPIAPQLIVAQTVTPQPSVAQPIAAQPIIAQTITAQPMTPQNVAPQNIAPQNIAPQNIAPQNIAPQNIAPRPIAAQPIAAPPIAPQPIVAQPNAPQPIMPQPIVAQPMMPQHTGLAPAHMGQQLTHQIPSAPQPPQHLAPQTAQPQQNYTPAPMHPPPSPHGPTPDAAFPAAPAMAAPQPLAPAAQPPQTPPAVPEATAPPQEASSTPVGTSHL